MALPYTALKKGRYSQSGNFLSPNYYHLNLMEERFHSTHFTSTTTAPLPLSNFLNYKTQPSSIYSVSSYLDFLEYKGRTSSSDGFTMVTMRQMKFALCFSWAIQMVLGIWFCSVIEHRCLFLFPNFSVKHAVLFVCFINLTAIFVMDLRGYYPTTIVMIVTGLIMLGLLVVSIVAALNTTNFAWRKDRDCLIAKDVCLDMEYLSYQNTTLSTIVSGCCVPPAVCGYSRYNPILFGNATNLDADPDCRKWNDDQDKLCYNCNSCEIGVLKIVKKIWLIVLIISVFLQISVLVALGLVLQMKAAEDERIREVELQA